MSNPSTKERKVKLRITIKEFNDKLLNLVTIQDKMEKITPLMSNKQQKQVHFMMKYRSLMSQLKIQKFYQQKNNVEEEIELIEATREKISKLKAELECKQDLIMQEESGAFEIVSDLYSKRIKALDELYLK